MALWKRPRAEPLKRKEETGVSPGRVSGTSLGKNTVLSPYRSFTSDNLKKLRQTRDVSTALHFLKDVHPDISMSLWNFVRLSNQGHEMRIYNGEERLLDAEKRWREFAERVNEISNSGLDGMIDQLHLSAFLDGAMGVELEVFPSLDDVVDLYPIKPQTIEWKLEDRNNREKWIPYQRQSMKLVSLENANFFWVPTDPNIDDPRGRLIMQPALQAIDFQMQVLQDLQQVIHNQGWPRYDISLALDRIMSNMPPNIKSDPLKQKEYLTEHLSWIQNLFKNLNPDDSFIHYDDITTGQLEGKVAKSIDIRAVTEMLDQQVMSGAKQMSVFLNRTSGVTETWGTVQWTIFAQGLKSIQRNSKRLMEQVCKMTLRVWGIQGTPKFTHNTIDTESEEQRIKIQLMEQEFWAIARLMGWVDNDRAASEVIGVNKAHTEPSETIRVGFSEGVGKIANVIKGNKVDAT